MSTEAEILSTEAEIDRIVKHFGETRVIAARDSGTVIDYIVALRAENADLKAKLEKKPEPPVRPPVTPVSA